MNVAAAASAIPHCALCRAQLVGVSAFGARSFGSRKACARCVGRLERVLRVTQRFGIAALREYVRARWPELYGQAQELYLLVREAQRAPAKVKG